MIVLCPNEIRILFHGYIKILRFSALSALLVNFQVLKRFYLFGLPSSQEEANPSLAAKFAGYVSNKCGESIQVRHANYVLQDCRIQATGHIERDIL